MPNFTMTIAFTFFPNTIISSSEVNTNFINSVRDKFNSSINSTTGHTHSGTVGDGPLIDLTVNNNFPTSIISPIKDPGFIYNIGISYGASTFRILQANGSLLDSTNFGYISVPAISPGLSVTIKVDSSFTFIDSTGASNIIGEQFGVTTGVAWGQDRPFYIYAVNGNDATSGLQFAISPNPSANLSPATANIGYKGNPAGTPSDNNFFFLTSTDVTLTHNFKPCRNIGAFRMRMNASDDWAVQAISANDGILKYHEQTFFIMPISQMGATAGKYFFNNGGTAPTYTLINSYKFLNRLNGTTTINATFSNLVGGVAGVGAQSLVLALPYAYKGGTDFRGGSGQVVEAAGTFSIISVQVQNNASLAGFYTYLLAGVTNNDQSSADRAFIVDVTYATFTI